MAKVQFQVNGLDSNTASIFNDDVTFDGNVEANSISIAGVDIFTAIPPGATGPTGDTGATGATGPTGDLGIIVSDSAPTNTAILWQDTTATAATPATIIVTAPIINTGTSTDANIGLDTAIIPTGNVISQHLNAPANSVETMNKNNVTTSQANTSGRVYLTMFTPLFTQTITNLVIPTGTVTSPSYTLAKLGLFTISGTNATLVAETASDTTLMATASTFFTRALSSARGYPTSYTLVAGTRYAFGAITVGTGFANLWTNSQLSNAVLSAAAPYTAGLINSVSDLPTAATGWTATSSSFFARCS